MHVLKDAAAFLASWAFWRSSLDVLLSSVIIYYMIMLIKGTRAVQLAWGLVLLFLFAQMAERAQFRTLGLLLGTIATPGATVAIVILFYPELRHALEEVGRGRLWAMRSLMLRREDVSAVVDDLVDTAVQLSHQRIGALIVLARDDGLDDVTSTGTAIGAKITPQLLISIFYPGTPLHDGAVIIRGNEVVAAACMLPLSDNPSISSSLHTRHRAALGLAEKNDAAVLVVSEETGNISLAYDGRLLTALRPEIARDKLLAILQRDDAQERGGGRPGSGKKGAPAGPIPDDDGDENRLAAVAMVGRAVGHRVAALGARLRGEAAE